MYLSRQLYEEALHVQFYLTLLDTYIPDHDQRAAAFAAVENIPSIRKKAEFCFKWIDSINELDRLETQADRRRFLLNLICFATCIEGLFFFGAFAYVYFLRSKGLLHGLAAGTNWVFRDESAHMKFALEVVKKVREEEPTLFDDQIRMDIVTMIDPRSGRLRNAVCRRHPQRRCPGSVDRRHAAVSRVHGRPASGHARHEQDLRSTKSVLFHGPSGRAGTRQLFRTPCFGLSSSRRRRSELQRSVLVSYFQSNS